MATTPRRRFLTEPGEPLLEPPAPGDVAGRFVQFQDATGLAADDIVACPLVAVPLPFHPDRWPSGRRRWNGMRPDVAWLPLMWLPDRIANRYTLVDDNGNERLEDDTEWAVRVALELTAAGVYDETSGGWVDVLALAGLDIDNDADIARVEEWLNGADDQLLDKIDLSAQFDRSDPDDVDWAVNAAADWMPGLQITAWATGADRLLGDLDGLVDQAPSMTGQQVSEAAALLARFAGFTLDGATDTEKSWFTDMATQADQIDDVQTLIDGPLATMADRLADVRDVFWPQLEDLAAQAG